MPTLNIVSFAATCGVTARQLGFVTSEKHFDEIAGRGGRLVTAGSTTGRTTDRATDRYRFI